MDAGHSSPLSAPMVEHLDNCLGCMACVTACPSGVQYDKLIEDTRAQVERNWRRPLARAAPAPRDLRAVPPPPAAGQAGAAHGPRPRGGAAAAPRAGETAAMLAPRATRAQLPEEVPATGRQPRHRGLRPGVCPASVLRPGERRLRAPAGSARAGTSVCPPAHRCCGALQPCTPARIARSEARSTIEAFERFDRVVVNAAGCGSSMKDYGHLLRDDPEWAERAARFADKVSDLTEILAEHEPRAGRGPVPHARGLPRRLPPGTRPGSARAAARAAARGPWAGAGRARGLGALLRVGRDLQPASSRGRPRSSVAARPQALLATGAEAVVAANPGCALQIQAHTRELGHELPVLHPAEVLDRSMEPRVSELRLQAPRAARAPATCSARPRWGWSRALHRELDGTRRELLARRGERQAELDAGGTLDFLPATRSLREGDWTVAPPPPAYADRRVEITGPTTAKMVINALNSGARGFMADFEDANSPTWAQHGPRAGEPDGGRARDAGIRRARRPPVPPARTSAPRCWCARAAGTWSSATRPWAASRCRAGCSTSRCTSTTTPRRCWRRGSGPFLYLPKLESHLEARLWNDAFVIAEEALGLDPGTIRATVLIETLPAAFEMDEILYELRDHCGGPQRGPLGLHLQRHQAPARASRVRAARPRAGHDDRAVHAGLRRPAGQDLPPPRHARDGWHVCRDPEPRGSGGGRAGEAGRGSRQGARGGGGIRRQLGCPPRLGCGRDGRVRRGAEQPREPDREDPRRRGRGPRGAAGPGVHRRARSPRPGCA